MELNSSMKKPGNSGVSIIELMMAIAMTSVIVTVVLSSWNNFTRHVFSQRRKSILRTEIKLISSTLASQLRRSPGIIAYHSSGITYISPTSEDTIAYEFNSEELLKNDKPIRFVAQNAYISEFIVEEAEQNMENNELKLLSFFIELMDDFDNRVSINSSVAVKILNEYEAAEEELNRWNF
jgi:Tfp pilus assembly protein PilE